MAYTPIWTMGLGSKRKKQPWQRGYQPPEQTASAPTSPSGSPALPTRTEAGDLGSYASEGGGFRVNRGASAPRPAPGSNFRNYPGLSKRRFGGPTGGARFTQRARLRPSLSQQIYGSRTREGNLQTGFGLNRPKLLSFRRFTSRWLSPSSPGRPAPGGLRQNPLYSGGGGESFGGGPGFGGTYARGQQTGQMGFRRTV